MRIVVSGAEPALLNLFALSSPKRLTRAFDGALPLPWSSFGQVHERVDCGVTPRPGPEVTGDQ